MTRQKVEQTVAARPMSARVGRRWRMSAMWSSVSLSSDDDVMMRFATVSSSRVDIAATVGR